MTRGLAIAVLAAALAAADASGARTVTDSAGRTVEVPDGIERVFASGPPATVLVYVLAPQTLVGWSRALGPDERAYVARPYRDLPEIGRLTGRGGAANLERVIAARPDLVVDFGSVRDTYVSLAERVQAQTGIPYVLVDGRFDNTAAALRLLGGILGAERRAERLAAYAEETFARVDAVLDRVPADARPDVYLARGPDGLETGLPGSINTEIIERAGGRNAIDAVEGRRGIAQVSMERVIAADPDVIVTWDRRFFDGVHADPLWSRVAAVREGRVHLAPLAPFGWIDRPPSLNRLIGLRWLPRVLHPEAGRQGDFRAEVREFYRLFYHVELDAPALDRLMP